MYNIYFKYNQYYKKTIRHISMTFEKISIILHFQISLS